jgi:hypothetical protein
MKSIQTIFAEVLAILESLEIPYMIGGSVAAIAYGEPRLTLDMDVVIDLNSKQASLLAKSFGPEYYVNLESMREAIATHGHFNIIQSECGVKVDFYILKQDDYNLQQFQRRKSESFDENRQAIFSSPEDIILKKLEWYKMGESEKHLTDIAGILKVSRDKLNFDYIDKWATQIGVADTWQKLKNNA